ncbi:O-antigen ligase family protein [Capsulimonas corticalis]|uniref:O-antigen ligase family protein n=1 Tax=Capsulimonas corticalis TaxID=2219043 RepID=UPI000E64D4CB|nr:O-antigen ligase family protein [Capsulimonas corticalis]
MQDLRPINRSLFDGIGAAVVLWAMSYLLFPMPYPYSGYDAVLLATSSDLQAPTSARCSCLVIAVIYGVVFIFGWSRRWRPLSLTIVGAAFTTLISTYLFGFQHYDCGVLIAFSLTLMLLCSVLTAERRALVFYMLALLLCMQAIVAVVLYYFPGFSNQKPFQTPGFGLRASAFFLGPNPLYPIVVLGATIALAREIIVVITLRKEKRVQTSFNVVDVLWRVMLSACLMATILTYSRAAWIAIAFVSVAVGSWGVTIIGKDRWFQNIHSLRFCLYIGLGIGLAIGSGFVRTHGNLPIPRHDRAVAGRVRIWRESVNFLQKEHVAAILFGNGPGAAELLDMGEKQSTDVKNWVLNTLMSYGLLGFAIYACAYIVFVISLIRSFQGHLHNRRNGDLSRQNRMDLEMTLGAMMMSCAVLIMGLFDSPILSTPDRIPATAAYLALAGVAIPRRSASTLRQV